MFAAFRHPEVAVAGSYPAESAEYARARGWYRVSDWSEQNQFNLPAYGPDAPDLDAPEPEPATKPTTKKTKESTAKPADDETEEQ